MILRTPCPLGRGVAKEGQSWELEQSSTDLRPKDDAENGLLGATFVASDINRNIKKNELQDGSVYA